INALEQLDPSLEQAAVSLGASQARAFFKVTVTLSTPGVVAGAILSFALTISAFITPAMVGGGSFIVMPTLIYQSAILTLVWPTCAPPALTGLVVPLALVWGGVTLAGRCRCGVEHAGAGSRHRAHHRRASRTTPRWSPGARRVLDRDVGSSPCCAPVPA